MSKKVRNNSYFLPRLEAEHPAIYADFKAGKYPSLRQALIAAGLKREPRRLNALKAAWKKASPADRSEFLKWVGAPTTGAVATATPAAMATLLDRDGRLLPTIADRVKTVMGRRGLMMGAVMREMGLRVDDGSLGNAMSKKRPTRPSSELVRALEKWLGHNKSYW